MRIALAAGMGGLIVSVWVVLILGATPLGDLGENRLRDEAQFLDYLRANVPEAGVYDFPVDEYKTQHKEVYPWQDVRGPSGKLVIIPRRTGGMLAHLALALTSIVAAAGVAAFMISRIPGSPTTHAIGVALMAGFGALAFPFDAELPALFTVVQLGVPIVGWFLAGLAMSLLIHAPGRE